MLENRRAKAKKKDVGYMEIRVGGRGSGKSYRSLQELYKSMGSTIRIEDPLNIEKPVWFDSVFTQNGTSVKPKKTVKKRTVKKKVVDMDGFHGKYCALVELTLNSVKHKGVLFVRKCGHWKLLDFAGNRIAGGSEGSYDNQIKDGSLKIKILTVIHDIERVEQTDNMDLEII